MNSIRLKSVGWILLGATVVVYLGFIAWLLNDHAALERVHPWLLYVSAALVLILALSIRHLSLVAKVNLAPPSKWLGASETHI